jgi:hypothetical protein
MIVYAPQTNSAARRPGSLVRAPEWDVLPYPGKAQYTARAAVSGACYFASAPDTADNRLHWSSSHFSSQNIAPPSPSAIMYSALSRSDSGSS